MGGNGSTADDVLESKSWSRRTKCLKLGAAIVKLM